MESLKYLPRYTVSDYNLWEGDWELIDGHPVSMSPAPVYKHQNLAKIILGQIINALDANQATCGDCEVVYELDWIVDEKTVLRPDICVICDQSGDFITKPPVLIIEILSPSTALRDKHVKHEIYQQHGVKYYMTADPATKTYQAYVLSGDKYQVHPSSIYTIHEGCNITIDMDALIGKMKG